MPEKSTFICYISVAFDTVFYEILFIKRKTKFVGRHREQILVEKDKIFYQDGIVKTHKKDSETKIDKYFAQFHIEKIFKRIILFKKQKENF